MKPPTPPVQTKYKFKKACDETAAEKRKKKSTMKVVPMIMKKKTMTTARLLNLRTAQMMSEYSIIRAVHLTLASFTYPPVKNTHS